MNRKIVRGFVWYSYPFFFGLEDDEGPADPGHPFATTTGAVQAPTEVVYFRPTEASDSGLFNVQHNNAYLIVTKTPHHPIVHDGWESEPAVLGDTFKTGDGRLKMGRIVQHHQRHAGDLLECELKLEED
jgi:hypothetical protein